LLGQFDPQADSLIDRDSGEAWSPRLAAYVSARRHFIAAGRGVPPLADPRAMLARVRDPLMNVLRESPDFRPAYDPLWRLATVVAAQDPHAARAVLTELIRLQPARAEAASELRVLGVAP
jgi:spermidine synthase